MPTPNLDQKSPKPLLTVIVPVFNEESTISFILQRVLNLDIELDVIVINDGSTDRTTTEMEQFRDLNHVLILEHSSNQGKGASIRTGLHHAKGIYTVIQDGDLEYNPGDYIKMIQCLVSNQADVVFGSRYLAKRKLFNRNRVLFRFGVSTLNVATRFLYGYHLTDEATCYKLFKTKDLRKMNLQCKRFDFCPEVVAKSAHLGLKIHEVEIDYESRSVQSGKKIRWYDGIEALYCLWKWRKWKPEAK
ncbi:MAG: glycosyltransferase family 2 protein [Verrucomicrobiota bacterium]